MKYNNCRACGNEELISWLSLPPSPVANALFVEPNNDRFPLDLNYCPKCGHLQLASAPDPEEVFANYKYRSGVSASFRRHFEKYAEDICKDSTVGKVLEVGSNDGYLLEQFKNHGWDVMGVEPASTLRQDHLDKGIPVITEFFTTETVKAYDWYDKFDVVCANNVLAHIPDIDNVIKAIALSLRTDGTLVAECNNQSGIIDGSALDNVYHEHIDYYTPHSFATLVERYGLIVYRVEAIPTHGISFRVYATKNKMVDRITQPTFIDTENTIGESIQRIDARKAKMKVELQGRKFVAYGAAAKAVTALYTLDLADSIEAVVDDNELKQGYYFPGTSIKITSSAELDPNALVVITAWNVYSDIKKKLEDRGHKGEILCLA